MKYLLIGIALVIILIIIVAVNMQPSTSTVAATQPSVAPDQPAPVDTTPVQPIAVVPATVEPLHWSHENGMNYIYGKVPAPKSNSADGNVQYINQSTTQDQCETACGGQTWCNGYTWTDGSGGSYANTCYGLKNVGSKQAEAGHYSGSRAENFTWQNAKNKVATFSNTLQRRFGMGSAAESSKQSFNPGNVAYNTAWNGYYKSSVLPS